MIIEVVNKISVPFVDFQSRYARYRTDILQTIDEVLSSGSYILGDYVERCEKALSDYLQCPYVITVANGTDALILSLKVLGVGYGDEVIVPVNSFIASAGAVVAVGATPVFCDVSNDLNIDVNQIEKHVSKKTKAIMPVHLAGRPADMRKVKEIAKHHNCYVIEDAAQAIGATYCGEHVGAIGDIGCFSLHPLKNLYVYGDGGFITTKNKDFYQKILIMRNHGLIDRDHCVAWGLNSRLDSVQANIVLYGLRKLTKWNNIRRKNAEFYQTALENLVIVPRDNVDTASVYHNFVVQTKSRDTLRTYLQEQGVETKVHYPIPLHLQETEKSLKYRFGDFPVAERLAKEMLSLPIYPELAETQLNHVIEAIKDFFNGQ
ncbi:MAG: hypothetical protein A3F11_04425 [Gammaproteobacteria bacterium RIFCSPHIGHO2_12_FULL_37_14]|nr:MAG: hypothetical protein A3F11_04425 [Gammaproteobacteria bacterium RIFCSPHIGHO2_12_FULL_37_14]